MKLVRLAAAVLNQTPLDWERNADNIRAAIVEARRQDAAILCLPELCITGYGCEDAFFASGVARTAQQILLELLPETEGMIVSFGLPTSFRGALYNTACLVADGELLGFVAKQNLAGEGIHYEPRWFKPWPHGRQTKVDVAGRDYPLGDLVFDCDDVLIGFEICEDAWVADRPGGDLARRGVDIILNPSASHFAFGKHQVRQRFVLEGSRAFHAGYVYANLLGNEAGRAIYDGDSLIAAGGRLLASGPRFSFRDWHLTSAVFDVEDVRRERAQTASYQPQPATDDACIDVRFAYPAVSPETRPPVQADWEQGDTVKEEEFTRAVSLALFDYMRKSRSHGFVVSLSGGADSAAVASLCALSVELGVTELGLEEFLAKVGYIPALRHSTDVRSVQETLLTCVYQGTRNSSQTTRDAARGLASGLGASFYEFDVDKIVQDYVAIVSQAIGRQLDWTQDDISLQNIQARARAPGVWLLANLRQALLLATSNRSEAAVGYTTMDGDTCGGLSPIAGIDKAFLQNWLQWVEKHGPAETGPMAALSAVNCQAPTAELRPPDAHQTDESDLMPYDLLDEIERAAIRDKQMPLEILQLLCNRRPEIPVAQLTTWIERFFRLWSRNQWKRERFAPSFHLDDENLDPKTWCRFPILSGGFQRELQQLRESIRGDKEKP
jgi:NAD+ synthase (glutamine-hydrolysing)